MHMQGEIIQAWLTTQLAEHLNIAPEDIDIQKPFTEYGLDSMVGVHLAGDLEDWLGLQLSPTLLWDYPTTATLTRHLAEKVANSFAREAVACQAGQALQINPAEAQQLLATLDDLSDADVDVLLATLLTTDSALA
jgi:acyl carrier protein